jgi:hypothetical protein
MKPIEPITIWKNGESQEADLLNAYIINDNLESSCTFYYNLCSSGEQPDTIGQSLADGNVSMSGQDYLAWDGDNNYAYTYIAQQLNLTLI